MICGLESVAGKVGQLASYQTMTGRPDYIRDDGARYENVIIDDVMRVYDQYLKDTPAVVMSIVPRGQLAVRASEDTWQRPERVLPDYGATAAGDLDERPATDDFDRSVMPAGDNPALTLPRIWRAELANGVRVDSRSTASVSPSVSPLLKSSPPRCPSMLGRSRQHRHPCRHC